MATKNGPGPTEPLDPKVVKKLLDLLSTDNDFRRLFKKDAHAALVRAGWKPSSTATLKASAAPTDLAALSGGNCLQMVAGARLAPKEKIVRERAKLEKTLNAVVNYACPMELQAD